jgi:glycosyltransferase involved in cell wall biosynthesis
MRLVYLLTSLGMGGAERQAADLAARMAQRGHDAALLVLLPRQPEQWATELQTVYLDMRKTSRGIFTGLLAGGRFLRAYRPDLIHSHTFPANLAGRVLAPSVPGVRLLATIHNVYEGGWQRSLAYRLTDGLSVATTAVSGAVAEYALRTRAVPAHKCSVLPIGIDTAEFAPSAQRRRQTRARMGVFREFVWLAAGRIVPAKDFPNLLRAFALVRRVRPEAQLWIAGESAGNAFDRVSEKTVEAALFEHLHWLGLRRDLPALLDGADGFVLSSAWEGMPQVVAEAMAMEKPVAATDVGGVRELLGECGSIAPAHNAERLAEAMLAQMFCPEQVRRAQGQRARQRIVEHFNMDRVAGQWEVFYRNVLAAKS